jgi:hypothetical protein
MVEIFAYMKVWIFPFSKIKAGAGAVRCFLANLYIPFTAGLQEKLEPYAKFTPE